MKKYIVITSINKPTKAVEEFDKVSDYVLIVVGDKKSPKEYTLKNGTYLSVDDQLKLDYGMAKKIPYNHYCRKMMGYLHAIKNGADVIADSDDDNIPNKGWSFPDFDGKHQCSEDKMGFVNIYKNYSKQHIWPRGFPLEFILEDKSTISKKQLNKVDCKVGVWQALADGDPDVDAIYRLIYNQECTFDKGKPIVLGKKTWCPYNSQNTATRKEFFALLYLPCFVSFRFTDILRGLVAQPILQAAGHQLGFTEATVFQDRNEHNFLNDFKQEIECYTMTNEVVEAVDKVCRKRNSVADNLYDAYIQLLDMGVVKSAELRPLLGWLKAIDKL